SSTSTSSPRKIWYEYYNTSSTTSCVIPPTNSSQDVGYNHAHLLALREIVGSTGEFYGFIGVEASLYSTAADGMRNVQVAYYTAGLTF
ncbi:MAG: hypothetical protein JWN62_1118, partial [Acidimicrobiales bacterium]|nr:hypothetical protein [Acidimicrobiales bacterium]